MTKINIASAFLIILLLLATSSAAVDQLISLQGKVTSNGIPVNSGNIRVTIYSQPTAGNLIYDSATAFSGKIEKGYFDIMLGSQTTLDLNYNQYYYIDVEVNGVDIDWNNGQDERMKFESTSGDTFAGDLKLESGSLRVCQYGDACIKFEQSSHANITTSTGDLYIDAGSNKVILNGNTIVSDALTINGGKITFGGTAISGDIFKNPQNDIVVNPEGGNIIFMLG